MNCVSVIGGVANWSVWLLRNWPQFQTLLTQNSDRLAQTLSNPTSAVQRFGNRLVFGDPEGGQRVIGFIEQAGPQLDAINDAVVNANCKLDVLQFGQQSLASSLSVVQSLSVVSLGFTAIVPVALFAAYSALRRHQTDMQKEMGRLGAKIAAMNTANLETGLEHLRLGYNPYEENHLESRDRLRFAHDRCTDARQYFGSLLTDELHNPAANRNEIRLLARYFTVAARGVAGSHVGLKEDETAKDVIQKAETSLRDVSRRIFHETVGKDPVRFLLPPVEAGGVKIGLMIDLYQQALAAGAIERQTAFDAAAWFEENRTALFAARAPLLRSWSAIAAKQHRELAEAVAVIEEVNRLKGLGDMIRDIRSRGDQARDIQAKLAESFKDSPASSPFYIWSME